MSDIHQKLFGKHHLLARLSSVSAAMLLCTAVSAQPVNDECSGAIELPGSAPTPPATESVDATGATANPSDPLLSCNTANGDGTQTVWFKYTPDVSGKVDINTLGSTDDSGNELDTAHGAFTGSCGSLTEVTCADFGLTDYMTVDVVAGTEYYIKVGQFDGGSDGDGGVVVAGEVVVNVAEPILPATIVLESVNNGVSASLGAVVNGFAPTSVSLDKMRNNAPNVYEVPNHMRPDDLASNSGEGIVGSKVAGNGSVKWRSSANLLQVFEGADLTDVGFASGFLVAPPDTVGDVGKDHYIQMTNLVTQIFDKEGTSVLGPFLTSAFFAGMDSNCAFEDWGDPIVIYDEETDRWLVSQFLAVVQDGLCIAVSNTSDPTGSWNQYEFDFTGLGFPDYPKYGFATDAVSVMINLFDPFQGSALGAIDKSELLAGQQATMVLFTGGVQAELAFGWVPGDNDGPVFDNTLPTFFTNLGDSGEEIYVAEMTPDWATPLDSELDLVAVIPVSPWDSDLCSGGRGACIAQPGSGTTDGGNPNFPDEWNFIHWLEGITDRMMHRGQTRDFGKRKIAMLSHTVDADGTGKAGVRWYELRNDKGRGWKLKKEGTFSPDGDNRWMGSVAMTAAGNTCLGYSISSETTHPSIGITGRKGTSNHMNIVENVAFDGNVDANVQRGTARWGDYSAMSIDPVNDTCWYTQEYAEPNLFFGEFYGWGTKVIQYDVN